MDVLCVGMYRSGSTWQYNIISTLLRRYREGCPLGFLTGDEYARLSPAGAADGWRVLKSHDGHPAFAAALAAGHARAVYSYRDLRDVAFSLVHKFKTTFEDIIEERAFLPHLRETDAFWMAQPGICCQRYERIIEDPSGSIAELAAHLQIPLAEDEAECLATEFSLSANLRRTTQLEQILRDQGIDLDNPLHALSHDPQTLLHWNHIRSGRTGAWKDRLTRRQLACLAVDCSNWLLERGYESLPQWWLGHLGEPPQTPEEVHRERIDALDELIAVFHRLRDFATKWTLAEQEKIGLQSERKLLGAELDSTRQQLNLVQQELERIRQELACTRTELVREREESARAREQTALVRAALTRLEELGPIALGLARRFHNLSLRYPYVSRIAKRILRFCSLPRLRIARQRETQADKNDRLAA